MLLLQLPQLTVVVLTVTFSPRLLLSLMLHIVAYNSSNSAVYVAFVFTYTAVLSMDVVVIVVVVVGAGGGAAAVPAVAASTD